MWTELFLENRDNLLSEVRGLIQNLQSYADALESRDEAALFALLKEGREQMCIRDSLKALGRVVYLEYPLPVLARRLGDFAKRGIAAEPGTTLEEIYKVRAPLYRRYADVTVRPEGSADDTAQRVLRALVER